MIITYLKTNLKWDKRVSKTRLEEEYEKTGDYINKKEYSESKWKIMKYITQTRKVNEYQYT